MKRGARRGAVEIHYDDELAPFHCPHCGMEFAPDDVLCISCGFEYADEQHPYALALRRPTPVLDATGTLTSDEVARLTDAVTALAQTLGYEVLLAVFPPSINRPPAEVAWFYGNQWQLGGVVDSGKPITAPPTDTGKLVLAAIGELLLLPWTILKSIGKLVLEIVRKPKVPTERGLLIAVFPEWQSITVEPTIAVAGEWEWQRVEAVMREAVGKMSEGEGAAVDAIVGLCAALGGLKSAAPAG